MGVAVIDFGLTDTQLEWQRRAREFAFRELIPRRGELDRPNEFPRELYQKAFDEGFLRISMPRDVGGDGLPFLDTLVAVEEVAYGDLGFATSLFVQWLAMGTLLGFGTDEQRQRWIAPMTRELSFCAFALTEPHAGSAGFQLARTTARAAGDRYLLNGSKCYITNSPVAEWLAVFAMVEPNPLPSGQSSLSCFVVPRQSPGLTVRTPYVKLGQRASATGEVTLENVEVPASALIGRIGQGTEIALNSLNRTRTGIGIMGVGVARAARDLVIQFAYDRRTFGNKRLITQQAFRFRLADIDIQIQAARLLGWRSGWELEHGDQPARWASTSKLFGGNMAVAVTGEAVEMLGGLGYLQVGGVEKLMRDAKLLQIYEGATAVQKILIAEYVTKREPWMIPTSG